MNTQMNDNGSSLPVSQTTKLFNYNGNNVTFKSENGVTYVNATEMAKPFGKVPSEYLRLPSTKLLIDAIMGKSHIELSKLIITIRGGSNPGTWLHEDIAIDFAQWLSIDFRLWCNDKIKELITVGNVSIRPISPLPNFIERYKNNYHKIDKNYFSVITEMFGRLYSALEAVGYVIPDKGQHEQKMMPDISVGRGFADFLKTQKSEYYYACKTYKHSFPDDRQHVDANMYPIDALPLFIRYLNEVWIPTKAQMYFKGRDDTALNYLPKLLGR